MARLRLPFILTVLLCAAALRIEAQSSPTPAAFDEAEALAVQDGDVLTFDHAPEPVFLTFDVAPTSDVAIKIDSPDIESFTVTYAEVVEGGAPSFDNYAYDRTLLLPQERFFGGFYTSYGGPHVLKIEPQGSGTYTVFFGAKAIVATPPGPIEYGDALRTGGDGLGYTRAAWIFEGHAGDMVNIVSNNDSFNVARGLVTLHDPDGYVIAEADGMIGAFTLPQDGTYTIGDELSLPRFLALHKVAPRMMPVERDEELSVPIPNTDVVFATFEGRAGEVVALEIDNLYFEENDCDVSTLIAPDDERLIPIEISGLCRLLFDLPLDGTYRFPLFDRYFPDEAYIPATTFTVTTVEASTAARVLTPSTNYPGSLLAGSTETWTFDGQAGMDISFSVTSNSLRPVVTLYDPSGTVVEPVGAPDDHDYLLPENGSYKVEVTDDGGRTGTYTMRLSIFEHSPQGRSQADFEIGLQSDTPGITLVNESLIPFVEPQEFCYVQITPVGAEDWGPERLGSQEILSYGVSVTWDFPPGRYLVLLANCDHQLAGLAVAEFDVGIILRYPHDFISYSGSLSLVGESEFIAPEQLVGALGNFRASANTISTQITLINDSDQRVCQVDMTPALGQGTGFDDVSYDIDFGRRLLAPGHFLEPGDQVVLDNVLLGFYDVRFLDCDSNIMTFEQAVDVVAQTTITFSGTDRAIEQAAPVLTLVNQSTLEICEFEITTTGQGTVFGFSTVLDIATREQEPITVPTGEQVKIEIQPGVYGVNLTYCGRSQPESSFALIVDDDFALNWPDDVFSSKYGFALSNQAVERPSLSAFMAVEGGGFAADLRPAEQDVGIGGLYDTINATETLLLFAQGAARQGAFSLAESGYRLAELQMSDARPDYQPTSLVGHLLSGTSFNNLADVFRQRGQFAEAQRLNQGVIDDAWRLISAWIFNLEGDVLTTDFQIETPWVVLRAFPPWLEAIRGQGLNLLEQGRFAEARVRFEEVFVRAYEDAANIYDATTPDLDLVLQQLDAAVEIVPDTSLEAITDLAAYLRTIEEAGVNAFIIDPTFPDFISLYDVGQQIDRFDDFGPMSFDPETALSNYYIDWTVARALSDMGAAEAGAGAPVQALHTYQIALERLRAQGLGRAQDGTVFERLDQQYEALTLRRIADVLLAINEEARALRFYDAALRQYIHIDDRSAVGRILGTLADHLDEKGNHDLAMQFYTQSLGFLDRTDSRIDQISARLAFADFLLRNADEQGALEQLTLALDSFELILGNSALDSAISSLVTLFTETRPYQKCAILLAKEGRHIEALEAIERGRAILTRTELTQTNAIAVGIDGVNKPDFAEQNDLLQAVQRAQQAFDALRADPDSDAVRLREAEAELNARRRDYNLLYENIQIQSGALSRQLNEVADIAALQAQLTDEQAFVVYALGRPDSIAFVIRPGVPIEHVILSGLDAGQLENAHRSLVLDRQLNAEVLGLLYDALIVPLDSALTGVSELSVVPDAELNYIPFAALLAPDDTYLVDQYVVRVVPNLTTFSILKGRESLASATGAGLAVASSAAPGYPPLAFATAEVDSIGNLLGMDTSTTGSVADIQRAIAGQRILHVSAHTDLSSEFPQFSALYLNPGDETDTGRLEVHQIYDLNLAYGTELVVLSACDTASGRTGEDFGTLTRAFLVAGANEVVASLWQVDDRATAVLMEQFYQELSTTEDAALAMQRAVERLRETDDFADPYFWAPFVVVGVPSDAVGTAPPFTTVEDPTTLPIPEFTKGSSTIAPEIPAVGPEPFVAGLNFDTFGNEVRLTIRYGDPQGDAQIVSVESVVSTGAYFEEVIEFTEAPRSLQQQGGGLQYVNFQCEKQTGATGVYEVLVSDALAYFSEPVYFRLDCYPAAGVATAQTIPADADFEAVILSLPEGVTPETGSTSNITPNIPTILDAIVESSEGVTFVVGDAEGDILGWEIATVYYEGESYYLEDRFPDSQNAIAQRSGTAQYRLGFPCFSDNGEASETIASVDFYDAAGNTSEPQYVQVSCTPARRATIRLITPDEIPPVVAAPGAPVIVSVDGEDIVDRGRRNLEITITYADGDGDATRIEFDVVEYEGGAYELRSDTLDDIGPMQQRARGQYIRTFYCDAEISFYNVIAFTLVDDAGNRSTPGRFRLNCTPVNVSGSRPSIEIISPQGTVQLAPVDTTAADLPPTQADAPAQGTVENCPGTQPSRLIAGEAGRVTLGGINNRLRAQPSTRAEIVDLIPPGAEFMVIAGPTCAENYAWWQVRYENRTGWTVEADRTDYWLEPLAQSGTAVACTVSVSNTVSIRSGPGTNYDRNGQVSGGVSIAVVGQSPGNDGYTWWKLADDAGWVREDVVSEAGHCASVETLAG